MTPYQERYYALRDAGTCVSCKRRDPMPGATQCGSCAEDQVSQKQALVERRKSNGLCPHCGKEPTPGYKSCQAARDAAKRYRVKVPDLVHSRQALNRASAATSNSTGRSSHAQAPHPPV